MRDKERFTAFMEGRRRLAKDILSKGDKINEANTRRMFIDPVLRSLGWDMEGYGQVDFETSLPGSRKIDYSLRSAKDTLFLIEAKPLTESITAAEIGQVAGYASSKGLRWAFLSNGRLWALYDARRAGGTGKERTSSQDLLVWSIDLVKDHEHLARELWASLRPCSDIHVAVEEYDSRVILKKEDLPRFGRQGFRPREYRDDEKEPAATHKIVRRSKNGIKVEAYLHREAESLQDGRHQYSLLKGSIVRLLPHHASQKRKVFMGRRAAILRMANVVGIDDEGILGRTRTSVGGLPAYAVAEAVIGGTSHGYAQDVDDNCHSPVIRPIGDAVGRRSRVRKFSRKA